ARLHRGRRRKLSARETRNLDDPSSCARALATRVEHEISNLEVGGCRETRPLPPKNNRGCLGVIETASVTVLSLAFRPNVDLDDQRGSSPRPRISVRFELSRKRAVGSSAGAAGARSGSRVRSRKAVITPLRPGHGWRAARSSKLARARAGSPDEASITPRTSCSHGFWGAPPTA